MTRPKPTRPSASAQVTTIGLIVLALFGAVQVAVGLTGTAPWFPPDTVIIGPVRWLPVASGAVSIIYALNAR